MSLRNRAWLRSAVNAINLVLLAGDEIRCVVHWQRWGRFPNYYGVAQQDTGEIWVHRALAYPEVPDYVVVHTLFHEMLHIRFGHEHDERFVLAERLFPHYADSMRWDAYHWNDHVAAVVRPDWRLLR